MFNTRKKFSHLGFAMAFYLLISNILSMMASSALTLFYTFKYVFEMADPDSLKNSAVLGEMIKKVTETVANAPGATIITMLPSYIIGVPLALYILNNKKYRDVPLQGLSFSTPYEKSMKRDLSVGEFLSFFLMTFPLGIIGSLIGNLLAYLIKLLSGLDMTNLLTSMLGDMQLWEIGLATVILAPIFEELLYRYGAIGYARRYGEWNAIFISALIFGLVHANIFQFFYAFLLGLLFGYVYIYTRQIKYTIALHMLFNFFGAFVPYLIAPDATTVNTAVMVYTVIQYLLAVVGLVMLILFIKKGNLFRTTPNSPVQGLCSVDSLFNFGMITLYICCIALTIFIMASGVK